LGSPLVGAFLLMEMIGLGGSMMEIVLVPGLLAAGVGSLIFVGLGSLTGFGTLSLSVGAVPPASSPTIGEFGWAIVIGVLGAVVATAVFRAARALRPLVERNRLAVTPLAGLAVGAAAILFAEWTGRSTTDVLFSGQSELTTIVQNTATWSAGALVVLVLCKGIAYAISLSGFRGGPIFPAMFIGAAGGMALSHLPGLPMIAGVAMGVGAMCAGALKMPMTSVLLPVLLFAQDAVPLMPLVIVAVVVAYVIAVRINPSPSAAAPAPAPAPVAAS
jgi:H+/Cl- antiporter ClcA